MNKFQLGDRVEYCGKGRPDDVAPWRTGTHTVVSLSRSGGIKLSCQRPNMAYYLSKYLFKLYNELQENE